MRSHLQQLPDGSISSLGRQWRPLLSGSQKTRFFFGLILSIIIAKRELKRRSSQSWLTRWRDHGACTGHSPELQKSGSCNSGRSQQDRGKIIDLTPNAGAWLQTS